MDENFELEKAEECQRKQSQIDSIKLGHFHMFSHC